jgi:uncharacterized protein YprB with RNaseH-like and TPR domain
VVDYFFDIETTGLNPFEHKVLTIQLKEERKPTILWKLWEEENETDLVAKFLNCLRNIRRYDSIIGYNCLQFDVPFIASRLATYGLIDREKYQVLYNRNWKDLYQHLGGNYVSLDRRLDSFGIRRRCSVKGVHVPFLYEQKRFREIEEHATEDVELCEELVHRMNERRRPYNLVSTAPLLTAER